MDNNTGQKFTVKHNSPLLKYLYELFPQQSKTGVKAYLGNGQILVNGEGQTAFDFPLFEGDRLTVLVKGVSLTREIKQGTVDVDVDAAEESVEEDTVEETCEEVEEEQDSEISEDEINEIEEISEEYIDEDYHNKDDNKAHFHPNKLLQ